MVWACYHRDRKCSFLPLQATFLCGNSAEGGELFPCFCCCKQNILYRYNSFPALSVNGKTAWERGDSSPSLQNSILSLFRFSYIFNDHSQQLLGSCREPKLGPRNINSSCCSTQTCSRLQLFWNLERPTEQKLENQEAKGISVLPSYLKPALLTWNIYI